MAAVDFFSGILKPKREGAGGNAVSLRRYQKFIVLSYARSGSSFLASSLDSHPRIVCFGEIFNPGLYPFDPPLVRGDPGKFAAMRVKDPVRMIREGVFRPFSGGIRAVGFKLLPGHLGPLDEDPVWDYLKKAKDLKIIHLKRRNRLETYLSAVLAEKTGVYRIAAERERFSIRVPLDYDACVREFERRAAAEERMSAFFSGHSVMEMFYEELAADYREQTRRVLEFIGVFPQDLFPGCLKQNVRPLSYRVQNYGELREKFRGTVWESFFEGGEGPCTKGI